MYNVLIRDSSDSHPSFILQRVSTARHNIKAGVRVRGIRKVNIYTKTRRVFFFKKTMFKLGANGECWGEGVESCMPLVKITSHRFTMKKVSNLTCDLEGHESNCKRRYCLKRTNIGIIFQRKCSIWVAIISINITITNTETQT